MKIKHVDHGKTTLIDGLFKQVGLFEEHEEVIERVMDSGDIEKERGITITAKNASFVWKGVKINIIDTPGHSDFGGEVERALFMVDGVMLLIDASEGPLPQTRFVLRKALEKNLKVIVVINKVDRTDSRIDYVEDKVHELFYDLSLSDEQTHYKTLYASAKEGWATLSMDEMKPDFVDLLDTVIEEIPAPKVNERGGFKMLVANITYNSFLGQIAYGRIEAGNVNQGQNLNVIDKEGKAKVFNVTALETFSGIGTERVKSLSAGNIALIAGVESPKIGDTICLATDFEALPRIEVDKPSVAIRFSVNTSPFAGLEGSYATTRKLESLLKKACLNNVAIELSSTDNAEVFLIKGRGELQIVVLIEELRREGWEFMVGRPEVIPYIIDGKQVEPEEYFVIDVPEKMTGTVTELLSSRGGKMKEMERMEASGRNRLCFTIPTRGLIGIRSRILTETRGEAIYSSSHNAYIPYQGKRFSRKNGALVTDRSGVSCEYGLFHLQSRGRLFIKAGIKVYDGMIFGENNQNNDMNANPTKEKKLTNVRAAKTDDSTKINPVEKISLDIALEWIDEDEWVEVTPQNIRIRKNELRSNYRKVIRRF